MNELSLSLANLANVLLNLSETILDSELDSSIVPKLELAKTIFNKVIDELILHATHIK